MRFGMIQRVSSAMTRVFWGVMRTLHLGILFIMLLVLLHTHRKISTSRDIEESREIYEHRGQPTKPFITSPKNCSNSKEYDNYRRAYPHGTDPTNPNPVIHITSLTVIQPRNWHWMAEGTHYFARHCPNLRPWMRCRYHQNATDEVIRRSHALLFHARHMTPAGGDQSSFRGIPTYRHPDQKWVFYEPEAPTNTWNYADRNAPYWKWFNLTATFTMDSNIPVRFHQRVCTRIPDWKPTNINYAGNRSLAAWFVSHCTCSSKRELYVNEMMKEMTVDIYGECGDNSACSRNSGDADACMLKLLNSKYKFYLSFENAFCSHYVTEKFHRIIAMVDVVPVVMGAADYVNILPEGSYIDIRDFKSPQELAKYLLVLDKNDTLYNQYIEAKKAYSCESLLPFPCSLCEYLHHHRHEHQEVYDASSFWSVEQRCVDPRYFYKGFADNIIPNIKYDTDPSLFL